jgi:hypothetical protein
MGSSLDEKARSRRRSLAGPFLEIKGILEDVKMFATARRLRLGLRRPRGVGVRPTLGTRNASGTWGDPGAGFFF